MAAITATAVRLVVDHREPIGPVARRAGPTVYVLRQAANANPVQQARACAPLIPYRYPDNQGQQEEQR
ncbi:hypothetical protein [Kitasatospora sp. MAP5-34]|uniref:hypothetical protein n=1 Tax=Kitasatospora sp. MAP5-34 TaxID=3035102 RepID=UPI0024760F5E|nr:hypothetical protein [Kitasatospora sp. MAP5-34]MDH6580762.1 hypothetical protein [Kitasatospora sp. MAP5-34]